MTRRAAIGTLELRLLESGVAGTLKIGFSAAEGWALIPVTGTVLGHTLRLRGPSLMGEIRRDEADRMHRVGELRHETFRYRLSGEWGEDREGRLLKCVVSEAA